MEGNRRRGAHLWSSRAHVTLSPDRPAALSRAARRRPLSAGRAAVSHGMCRSRAPQRRRRAGGARRGASSSSRQASAGHERPRPPRARYFYAPGPSRCGGSLFFAEIEPTSSTPTLRVRSAAGRGGPPLAAGDAHGHLDSMPAENMTRCSSLSNGVPGGSVFHCQLIVLVADEIGIALQPHSFLSQFNLLIIFHKVQFSTQAPGSGSFFEG